jgi:hypothetical protein
VVVLVLLETIEVLDKDCELDDEEVLEVLELHDLEIIEVMVVHDYLALYLDRVYIMLEDEDENDGV